MNRSKCPGLVQLRGSTSVIRWMFFGRRFRSRVTRHRFW